MTDDEYADWSSINDSITAVYDRASSPCQDCTMPFALAMAAQRRCDGRPGNTGWRRTVEDRPVPTPQELYAQGYRGQRIASIIGAAVKHQRTIETRRLAVALYNGGMTQYAIARALGLSQACISKYVREAREAAA